MFIEITKQQKNLVEFYHIQQIGCLRYEKQHFRRRLNPNKTLFKIVYTLSVTIYINYIHMTYTTLFDLIWMHTLVISCIMPGHIQH